MPIKDWGPNYKQVADLIDTRSKAITAHNQALEAEVAGHDGSHGMGRHGFQTGWEAQLIRAVTGITPDQPNDPRGLGAYIRQWNYDGSMTASAYGMYGATVTDLLGTAIQLDYGPTKKMQQAGGFHTAEAQQRAIHSCEQVLQSLQPHPVAQYKNKNNAGTLISLPYTEATVVVPSLRAGDPYGIGFKPLAKGVGPRTRDEVVRLLAGFFNRQTWEQLYPNRTISVQKYQQRSQIAFPQVGDLFEFLKVEPIWQTSALGVFRRTYTAAGQTMGGWRRVTIFPCDDPAGWAPSLYLSDANKALLAARNLPQKGYKWTGAVGGFDSKVGQRFPVPVWV